MLHGSECDTGRGCECEDGGMMDEDCSLRPGATDFSIAAIMARQDRPGRVKKPRREEDAGSLGKRPEQTINKYTVGPTLAACFNLVAL